MLILKEILVHIRKHIRILRIRNCFKTIETKTKQIEKKNRIIEYDKILYYINLEGNSSE